MKKLLFAAYLILVVAASLAARAEEIVLLENAQVRFDHEREALKVAGRFPTPCTSNAQVVLNKSEQPGVLYVDVVATHATTRFCSAVLGGIYQMDLNVRALKYELQRLNEPVDGQFTLVSRDGRFHEVIDFSKYNFAGHVPHPQAEQLLQLFGKAGGVEHTVIEIDPAVL